MVRANDLISCSDNDLRAHRSFFVCFVSFFVVVFGLGSKACYGQGQ